jgi:RHS repeat-associated protein
LGYDVANRLATVSSSNAYAYDPANQRAYFRNTAGSETLYFYGLGGKKLATYTIAPSGSQVSFTFLSRNIYFAGKLISAEGKAVSVDRLGSVRWNATAGNHTYYPYGAEYSATSNDTEKYASYTRDSLTGLDYAMNRYYSSAWGRFMTPDPTWRSASLSNPQSWNRYMYALGDPIAGSDPTGLDDVDDNDGCPDGAICFSGGGGGGGGDSGGGDVGPSTIGIGSDGSLSVFPDAPPCFSSSAGACGGTYTLSTAPPAGQLSPDAQTVIGLVNQANPGAFINTAGAVMASWYLGGVGLAEGLAGLAATAAPVVIAGAESPEGQNVIVNIGGAFEGPSNAIILQQGQLGGSTEAGLQNAMEIAAATGQPVVIGAGNAIPFGTGTVNQVIMNNVPLGSGFGYYGPYVDPSEVLRILAPGGTVTGSTAGEFYGLVNGLP